MGGKEKEKKKVVFFFYYSFNRQIEKIITSTYHSDQTCYSEIDVDVTIGSKLLAKMFFPPKKKNKTMQTHANCNLKFSVRLLLII